LRFPPRLFALAVQQTLAAAPDSGGWRVLAREPYELALPADRTWWTSQAFTSSRAGGGRFEGFLLGRFGNAGPELWSVVPATLDAPPQLLVGSGDTMPGPLRLWLAENHLASSQARFVRHGREAPRLERVFLTWGNRAGEGASSAASLRDLAHAGPPGAADTSLAARWSVARRLFAQLDSALATRDFERFGQIYRQLRDLFAARRVLAPAPPPR
jgi:hypothetical protein